MPLCAGMAGRGRGVPRSRASCIIEDPHERYRPAAHFPLSGSAAARHRRFPPHDRAAVRRPREIRPRAGRRDEGRQADPAADPEERGAGRSASRRSLHRRHRRHGAAAAEAARRHREGAGRRRPRARIVKLRRERRISSRPSSRPLPTAITRARRVEALARTVVAQFEQYIKLNKKIPPEMLVSVDQIEDPSKLADTVASHLGSRSPRSRSCWRPTASSSGWRGSSP